jgi:putative addiction module component (TIGR02574 family)
MEVAVLLEIAMSENALRLKDEMLALPAEERLELFRILWDSIDDPADDIDEDDAAWIAELDRRADDLKTGKAAADPVNEVFAALRDEALREQTVR